MASSVSRETLEQLATRFGLPDDVADRFELLLAALAAEADPPTTLRSPAEALDGHLRDALTGLDAEELGRAGTIADLGSGAGFPGLVLAVALPGARVDLVEASRRKCEVIERLAAAAGLSNARALRARAEEWGAGEGRAAYDAVTARALDSLAVLVEYAAPLLREGGVLVAWKGARNSGEEEAGLAAAAVVGLEPRSVLRVEPVTGARDRHLHVFEKLRPTPDRFPRRPGMARKRPLA